MTKEISKLCGKLKMERPRNANTHVSGGRSKSSVKFAVSHDQEERRRLSRKLLTAHKGHSAQRLLHEDLGNGREVVMCVVRHHNSSKQDRHDS